MAIRPLTLRDSSYTDHNLDVTINNEANQLEIEDGDNNTVGLLQQIHRAVPIGTIAFYPFSTAPYGYILLDGKLLGNKSTADYKTEVYFDLFKLFYDDADNNSINFYNNSEVLQNKPFSLTAQQAWDAGWYLQLPDAANRTLQKRGTLASTGGADSQGINVEIDGSGFTVSEEDPHTHTFSQESAEDEGHTHEVNIITTENNSHNHVLTTNTDKVAEDSEGIDVLVLPIDTQAVAAHSHNVVGETEGDGAHTHMVEGTTALGGGHDHTLSGTVTDEHTINIVNKYVSVNVIMKYTTAS